ncbi:ABC transporter ATP-binding protein [Devosia sp. 2618]|uniref:ABC transporter ATP-binding protein n=1 Tax=Devosia sp. 2618 TaxID=3156454 RepID=UPI0033970756
MSQQKTPTLVVDRLSTSLFVSGRWRPIVSDISFSIARGETLAVVGESGSGKSITALSVMGLLPRGKSRTSGTVTFDGRNLLTLPDQEMRRIRGRDIAMIFQETSLNPVYTVGFHMVETIRQHLELGRQEARKLAVELLERVRIPAASHRLDDYPHQFSGGMRQRVMIALALATNPRLLIADEPTTALDVTIQAQILELIKEIQAEYDMSVMFITHDMGVVAEVADQTMVMYHGACVEKGATAEIFRDAEHPYTRALLSAVPRLGKSEIAGNDDEWSEPITSLPQVPEPNKSAVPLLEVRDLTKRFEVRGGPLRRLGGRVHAVEGVSFHLAPGETLSLVGESGSGKSTTGRLVMRLLEPTAGSIKVDGRDISSLSQREMKDYRRKVQIIFQDPVSSLNPRMTIGAALTEPFLTHGMGSRQDAEDKAVATLERVGLKSEMFHRFPHEFSGGQRQRICIARALMLEPKLIVADEAVSALDVSVKAQVMELLAELQRERGLSYLFISHDMAVVERFSHRVAVMYLGEIVEIGPQDSVFSSPAHPYTRRLLDAVPIPDPSRRSVRRVTEGDEIRSTIKPLDWVQDRPVCTQVGEGHFVLESANRSF